MALRLFLLIVAVTYVNAVITFQDSNERIINAPVATYDQFPFSVSIQQISVLPNYLQAHRCGGAMFTLQHALTVASCVTIVTNNVLQPLPFEQYRVFAGNAFLATVAVENNRAIANFTIHPDFVPYPALLNDIAIVTVTQPFLNTTVIPISLPESNFVPLDFTLCNLAGWGAPNATSLASEQLRYTTKYVYNHNRCTNLWNMVETAANIFPTMICAASYDIISSGCAGDIGNPLICSGQLTGVLFLTNNCQLSSFPEVYTQISNYTTWIRSISGASTFRVELSVMSLVVIVCMKMFI